MMRNADRCIPSADTAVFHDESFAVVFAQNDTVYDWVVSRTGLAVVIPAGVQLNTAVLPPPAPAPASAPGLEPAESAAVNPAVSPSFHQLAGAPAPPGTRILVDSWRPAASYVASMV